MSTIESPLSDALHRFEGLADQNVLLAVSGGADSMALLHGCLEAGIKVGVAHLDHTTRDGVSTEDAVWLEAQVAKLNVPFFRKQVDVPALAETSNQSFEEVARTTRYDFLVDVTRTNGYSAIATAHHADDQAETVLMRILRGTSITGLAGIPARGEWDAMPVLRPLLSVSRANLIEYLTERTLEWREDASNSDLSYLRNRIRNTLLPVLRMRFNPGIVDALNRLAELSRADDQFLNQLAEEAFSQCTDANNAVNRDSFRQLDPALQRRVAVRLAQAAGGTSEFSRIDEAVDFLCHGTNGQRFDFGNNAQLSNGKDTTIIAHRTAKPDAMSPTALPAPGDATAANKTLRATLSNVCPASNLKTYCNATRQVLDADRIQGDLVIRTREPGDRFIPMGMSGSKKLKDYFGELGLPLEQRDATLLITSGGSVLWVVGHAIAGPYAVTPSTERFLTIEVSDAAE